MKREYSLVFSLILACCVWITNTQVSLGRTEQETSTSSKTAYQDWQDARRQRDVPVKIYFPQTGSVPYPVVIFSHGLGGTREAAAYLGDYWSKHGYLCVFVQHAGSDDSVWRSAVGNGRDGMMQSMKAAANGENLVARVGDIKFVLDQLERHNQEDPALKNRLDLSKIALAGHSFGAGTTLAVAGQNFGQAGRGIASKDERIKAAIYLCPPVTARLSYEQAYGSIQIPGLLLTGTEDNSPIGETKAEDRRIPFDNFRSPHQYLVNFIGADHATFGGRSFRAPKDSDEKYHEMIDEVTTKFLDATLKSDASAQRWLDGGGASAYLNKAAKFERK
jgi:predicted dienelactone hydrolase